MTICDFCKAHAQRRNTVRNNDILHLVNIPKQSLQKLRIDDLTFIYQDAKEGMMVCQDCIRLCKAGSDQCSPTDKNQNLNAYQHRLNEDKATLRDVLEELDRRIHLKETLEDLERLKM